MILESSYSEKWTIAQKPSMLSGLQLYASIPDVFVPVPHRLEYGKVLTMEWVSGARLSDKASIERMGLDSSKFVIL